MKNQKLTINPNDKDHKCFQHALTGALNYQNIKKNLEKLTKIKLFVDQYDWKKQIFHLVIKNPKSLNQTISQLIALNILLVSSNSKK